MTDYIKVIENLNKAKEAIVLLQNYESSLESLNVILSSNNESPSFFQHGINIKINGTDISLDSPENVIVLSALKEKIEADVTRLKLLISSLNVNINDKTS